MLHPSISWLLRPQVLEDSMNPPIFAEPGISKAKSCVLQSYAFFIPNARWFRSSSLVIVSEFERKPENWPKSSGLIGTIQARLADYLGV